MGQAPPIGVAQLEPQVYGAQEDHGSLGPLVERILGNRALDGALPSQSGSFYVLASHGFRRMGAPTLWDAWPAYLGRVPAVDARKKLAVPLLKSFCIRRLSIS